MGGTPAGYEEIHLNTQAYLFTGFSDGTTAGFDPNADRSGSGGVLTAIENLQGIVNPYEVAVAYNPFNISEPLLKLIYFLREIEEDIRSDMQLKKTLAGKLSISRDGITLDPLSSWPGYYSAAKTLVDIDMPAIDWEADFDTVAAKLSSEFGSTYIDGRVTEYETAEDTRYLARAGEIQNKCSDLNAINTNARTRFLLMLELEQTRNVAEFRSKLELENDTQRLALTMQGANALSALKQENGKAKAALDVTAADSMLRSEAMAVELNLRLEELFDKKGLYYGNQLSGMLAAINTYVQSQRAYVSDKIQLRTEANLWDVRQFEHLEKAMSVGNGGTVVPEKPNQFMEAVSTGASIIASLGPLISALG